MSYENIFMVARSKEASAKEIYSVPRQVFVSERGEGVVQEGDGMQESAVSLFSKKEIDYIEYDKKYVEFITNELTKRISDRLIQVLETNDEIILKKPVLRVSEYQPTNSVEYKKTVDWEPLVRCKKCKHWDEEFEECDCPNIGRRIAVPAGFYCGWGERRE